MGLLVLVRCTKPCQAYQRRNFGLVLLLISVDVGFQRQTLVFVSCIFASHSVLALQSHIQRHNIRQTSVDSLTNIRRKGMDGITDESNATRARVIADAHARRVLTVRKPRPLGLGEAIPLRIGYHPTILPEGHSWICLLKPLPDTFSISDVPYLMIRPRNDVGRSDGIVVLHGEQSQAQVVPRPGVDRSDGVDAIALGRERPTLPVGYLKAWRELQHLDPLMR